MYIRLRRTDCRHDPTGSLGRECADVCMHVICHMYMYIRLWRQDCHMIFGTVDKAMHVCTRICTCMCMLVGGLGIQVHVYVYSAMSVCCVILVHVLGVHTTWHVCIYMPWYARMSVHIHVCMYVCIYIYIYIYIIRAWCSHKTCTFSGDISKMIPWKWMLYTTLCICA